ncbi:MAG: LytTR family DNA-binding domain-containing protein [Bacteroidota bacterium]|nr:LytTR family DNA-binding domain-containing protein [Bacteroidota bacterium]
MIRAVLIDDESSCREALSLLLKEFCPQVELLGMAGSLPEGINLIREKKPELVFLDVELKNHLGFKLFESFPNANFHVVFCTAHEKYALQAIKTSCLEYLLKPIDPVELMNAVDKFKRTVNRELNQKKVDVLLENAGNASQVLNKIAVPTSDGYFFINTSDILYFEGDGKYTNMFTNKGDKIVSSKNLGEFEELLSHQNFFRCHKSWLINLNYIKKYMRGDGQVIMSNDKLVDVSIRKKEEFLKLFDRA